MDLCFDGLNACFNTWLFNWLRKGVIKWLIWLMNWFINVVNELVDGFCIEMIWLFGWLVDWLVGWLGYGMNGLHLIDWLICSINFWVICWLIDNELMNSWIHELIGWSVGICNEWLVDWLIDLYISSDYCPLHLALLDEVVANHPLLHSKVLALFTTLFEGSYGRI